MLINSYLALAVSDSNQECNVSFLLSSAWFLKPSVSTKRKIGLHKVACGAFQRLWFNCVSDVVGF